MNSRELREGTVVIDTELPHEFSAIVLSKQPSGLVVFRMWQQADENYLDKFDVTYLHYDADWEQCRILKL